MAFLTPEEIQKNGEINIKRVLEFQHPFISCFLCIVIYT